MRVTVAILTLLAAMPIAAHPMPSSEIFLDLETDGVRAEIRLPLYRLHLAAGSRLGLDLNSTTKTINRREIERYVFEHFSILDADGTPWNVRFEHAAVVSGEMHVRLFLKPRARSSSVRDFRLRSDLIVHQLVTHKIVVLIRRDELRPNATLPESVGRLTYRTGELTILPSS